MIAKRRCKNCNKKFIVESEDLRIIQRHKYCNECRIIVNRQRTNQRTKLYNAQKRRLQV